MWFHSDTASKLSSCVALNCISLGLSFHINQMGTLFFFLAYMWRDAANKCIYQVLGRKGVLSKIFQPPLLEHGLSDVTEWLQSRRRWKTWEYKRIFLTTFAPWKPSENYLLNAILLIDHHPQPTSWVLQLAPCKLFHSLWGIKSVILTNTPKDSYVNYTFHSLTLLLISFSW